MKKIVLLIGFILCSFMAHSQNVTISSNNDKKHDDKSTSLIGGRYEFIMSDKVVRLSFKVDKYSGTVYQLVENGDKNIGWEKLQKDLSSDDIRKDNSINYQLYMSGIAARFCFLINVNTGITWQLVESKDGILYFEVIG